MLDTHRAKTSLFQQSVEKKTCPLATTRLGSAFSRHSDGQLAATGSRAASTDLGASGGAFGEPRWRTSQRKEPGPGLDPKQNRKHHLEDSLHCEFRSSVHLGGCPCSHIASKNREIMTDGPGSGKYSIQRLACTSVRYLPLNQASIQLIFYMYASFVVQYNCTTYLTKNDRIYLTSPHEDFGFSNVKHTSP